MHNKPNPRKLTLFISAFGVLIVAIVIGGLLLVRANATVQLNSINAEQALTLPKEASCLANNSAVKAEVVKKDKLSEEGGPWTSHIYDVPAGTNVDVNIASYSEDTITGSLVYGGGYGSYNFTLKKYPDSWYYTKFTGCN